MDENLLNPTLKDKQFEEIKSYDIYKLFYIAFFGGLVATIITSAKNAKWLKVDKKIISISIEVGIVLLLFKVIALSAMLNNVLIEREYLEYLRWGSRIATVSLYFVNFKLMQKKYRKHIMLGGEDEPLLKDAIGYIILGSIIEFVLLFIGKEAFNNVF